MNRIFISYKRVDKDNVFKIKDQIESALGEKCWIDLEDIESDSQFKNVIIKAINECEIILFMYSKAHSKIVDFEKDWTIRELNFASSKNKKIVFVNLDGSPLTDEFVFDYGTKQQIDGQSNDSLKRFAQTISTRFGKMAESEGCKRREEGGATNKRILLRLITTVQLHRNVTLLYPTIVISKAFKKRGSMFVYYIVCGWLIPYLLYQSIVEDILIRN